MVIKTGETVSGTAKSKSGMAFSMTDFCKNL
jgi:hypothetical protein